MCMRTCVCVFAFMYGLARYTPCTEDSSELGIIILDKLVSSIAVCSAYRGFGPLYLTLYGCPITILGRNLPSPSSKSHSEG